MSLLLGFCSYDDIRENESILGRMYSSVKDLPHDRMESFTHENVCFANLITYNTPQAIFEKQPFYLPDASLLFSAKGRIDNREELATKLALEINDTYPDGTIILEAFLKWGKDCVRHLLGDWCFAAFDYTKQELFIARDQLGYSPVYYINDNTGFYFSSTIKNLISLPYYNKRLNEIHLVRFLTCWEREKCHRETFFENISILSAAQTLTLKDKKIVVEEYWNPQNISLRTYKNPQQYVDEAYHLFERAINTRLISTKPVASMLSGGLDSSSVAYVAASILKSQKKALTTFSHVPLFKNELSLDRLQDTKILDEGPLINEIAKASGNIQPRLLNSGNEGVLSAMREYLSIHSAPSHSAVNSYWFLDILNAAATSGFGALLTGDGGNGSLSFIGIDYLIPFKANMFLHNPWLFFKKQIAKPLLLKYFPQINPQKSNPENSIEAYITRICIQENIVKKYNILEDLRSKNKDIFDYIPNIQMLKKSFIDSYGVRGNSAAAFGNYYGIELRDPYSDIALTEFFFSIPNEVFFDRDYNNRMLIKRIMKGKLPENILWEKKRGLQSADIAYRMRAQAREVNEEMQSIAKSPSANYYIDIKKLSETWKSCLEESYASPYVIQRQLKATHFAMFLQKYFD